MGKLFSSAMLGSRTLENRIIVAPVAQHASRDGTIQPWHEQHYGHLSCTGVAAVTIEATSVSPDGRATPGSLGLWNDVQLVALMQFMQRLKSYSPVPVGIQLDHAGRKSVASPPWEGGAVSLLNGWKTSAPSAIPWGRRWPVPRALDWADIRRIVKQFIDATERADEAGVDYIEINSARGYLLHSFLSPLSNKRTDEFGGGLENRMRFPLQVIRSIRKALPSGKPLGVCINASDLVRGGWDIGEACEYAGKLVSEGVDYISVASGGVSEDAGDAVYENSEFSRSIRDVAGCPVVCTGHVPEPLAAEAMVAGGQCDFLALGRSFIADDRWLVRAASALAEGVVLPPQYTVASTEKWPFADFWCDAP
ncbi:MULTISPECIES: oxidoreductase [Pseudomonas]|uniref:oxidoreductase n=1 Tax=Pseudomonas TaxID=286 RepID=UPI00093A21BA|nr:MULTISPECIES: hypothetical protein [Pseudomonas]MDH0639608.1 oxidoreductase [Pseudomonas sp. GD03860]